MKGICGFGYVNQNNQTLQQKNHVLSTINHFLHRTMLNERYSCLPKPKGEGFIRIWALLKAELSTNPILIKAHSQWFYTA
jgi:hypothetical protein